MSAPSIAGSIAFPSLANTSISLISLDESVNAKSPMQSLSFVQTQHLRVAPWVTGYWEVIAELPAKSGFRQVRQADPAWRSNLPLTPFVALLRMDALYPLAHSNQYVSSMHYERSPVEIFGTSAHFYGVQCHSRFHDRSDRGVALASARMGCRHNTELAWQTEIRLVRSMLQFPIGIGGKRR
jgi:hypothetical protein